MPPILFPLTTSPGMNVQESGGRLINAYAEPLGDGSPAANVIRRAPGLAVFSASTQTGYRGSILVNSALYVAYAGKLYTVDSTGAQAEVGDLSGSGRVYFARNNKTSTPDVTMVTENGWYSTDGSTVTQITDIDLPNPNSVCFLDGYFFLSIGDGRCFSSGINDVTIASTDYVRAEAKPDGLTRVIPFDRDLFLCGPGNIEVWSNTGNATGFPFSRTTVIWRGLISPGAIAGFEDGFGGSLLWVGDDCRVHQLVGYEAPVVSPPSLDRLLLAVADKDDIEAFVYLVGGHPCWCVKGPSFCWVYDLATKQWSERQSYLSSTWRAVGNATFAFGRWLVGDANSGDILEISENAYGEGTDPLVYEVQSIQMGGFPARLAVPRADFNFVEAVGSNQGATTDEIDPNIEISWSDDRGLSWATPLLRTLGREGTSRGRISVNRTGMTTVHGRRWRLRSADPVYLGLLGGDMVIEQRSR